MIKVQKKIGIVDAGSNSFILLVAEKKSHEIRYLIERTTVVGMGKLLFKEEKAPLLRAQKVVTFYHRLMNENDVSKRVIVGTEVFRKLPKHYFNDLAKDFDDAFILSGEEEARLSYLSVVEDKEIPYDSPLVVDVGGGSVEYSYVEKGKVVSRSFPIGARVITEKFVRGYPIKSMKEAETYVENAVKGLPHLPIVSIGGSGTTLASIVVGKPFSKRLHGKFIEKAEIEKIYSMLLTFTLDEIGKLKGMEKGREEIAAAGVLLLLKSVELSLNDGITISIKGHRYAIARKMLNEGEFL